MLGSNTWNPQSAHRFINLQSLPARLYLSSAVRMGSISDILPPRGRDTVQPAACVSSCSRRTIGASFVEGSLLLATGWSAEASDFTSSAVLSGTTDGFALPRSPLASPFCFLTRFCCPFFACRSASAGSLLRFFGRVSRRFESGVVAIVPI